MCKNKSKDSSRSKCDICSRFFVNEAVLNKHVNAIHKNVFLFKCSYDNCTRTFRTGYRLYVHELSHKGIKPFKCQFCSKGFAEKGTLKVHVRSHSSICYYNCEYCTYGCKTESHLREHYKNKHHKFDFYKCGRCNKHFNFKSDYVFHLKEHQGNTANLDSTNSIYSLDGRELKDYSIIREISFGVYVA